MDTCSSQGFNSVLVNIGILLANIAIMVLFHICRKHSSGNMIIINNPVNTTIAVNADRYASSIDDDADSTVDDDVTVDAAIDDTEDDTEDDAEDDAEDDDAIVVAVDAIVAAIDAIVAARSASECNRSDVPEPGAQANTMVPEDCSRCGDHCPGNHNDSGPQYLATGKMRLRDATGDEPAAKKQKDEQQDEQRDEQRDEHSDDGRRSTKYRGRSFYYCTQCNQHCINYYYDLMKHHKICDSYEEFQDYFTKMVTTKDAAARPCECCLARY